MEASSYKENLSEKCFWLLIGWSLFTKRVSRSSQTLNLLRLITVLIRTSHLDFPTKLAKVKLRILWIGGNFVISQIIVAQSGLLTKRRSMLKWFRIKLTIWSPLPRDRDTPIVSLVQRFRSSTSWSAETVNRNGQSKWSAEINRNNHPINPQQSTAFFSSSFSSHQNSLDRPIRKMREDCSA